MANARVREALERIIENVENGRYTIGQNAQRRIEGLDYDIDDVEDCICELTEADFKRELPSKHRDGTYLYEFRVVFERDELYVKIADNPEGAFVTSFKLWGTVL